MTQAQWLLGVDTGGTFTDFVLVRDGKARLHKVLSTPASPEAAILQGIAELGLSDAVRAGQVHIIHGSTVATNAALEAKWARTAFVATRGFADLLTIGRQARRELYVLQPAPVTPPVPDTLCFGIDGRIDAHGQIIEPLTDTAIDTLKAALRAAAPEAIAVCLLFSHRNDVHEQALLKALREVAPVSLSSQVWPASGEYERGMATFFNAALGPRVKGYIDRLIAGVAPAHVAMMQSSGVTMAAPLAAHHAVRLLLSGPAGGLAGAHYMAKRLERPALLTFDMGGTSTDVALIDGAPTLTHAGHIGHWPVAVPMVDLHTIGAGGGSLAALDAGGLLQVGPHSAGARPGPACYGLSGQQPTVTDANAVLGRLRPEFSLGGTLTIDINAAHQALTPLATRLQVSVETAAAGIIALANEHMARALRVISIERGRALDGVPLFCFGGAGGLHVCDLADALGLSEIIVPAHGGVYSALGMLVAPRGRHEQKGLNLHLDTLDSARIEDEARQLLARGRASLHEEGVRECDLHHEISLELRYAGQQHCLTVAWTGDPAGCIETFHQLHEQRHGHRLAMPVELALLRVTLSAAAAIDHLPVPTPSGKGIAFSAGALHGHDNPVPLWRREDMAKTTLIHGPALIGEAISTTWVAPGWQAQLDQEGNLRLTPQV